MPRTAERRWICRLGLTDAADNVVLDPDGEVRRSITHLFETFERTGSASATVKHFREHALRFPRRPRRGPHKGELLWESLRHWRVLSVLHNPRYAGAFCFGRTRTHKRPGDTIEVEALPRDEWIALFHDVHPGYIPWGQFEADLARRRFMAADPGNRLVVDVLEAEWNGKLRALHEAQEELECRGAQDRQRLSDERRQQILALATDFPRLWNDPKTPQRERKRMVRQFFGDVTLTNGDEIVAGVRFRGGATRSLTLPLAQPPWQIRQTSAQVGM